MTARIAVVIPCYNYGHFVIECVTSVLAQVGVALDVLVIDDASTDGSWSIVERLPALSSAVRVHRNAENLGLIATVNAGLSMTNAEFVVVLSADDLLAPGALGRATDALRSCPEATFAYGPVLHVVDDQVPRPRHGRPRSSVVPGREWIAGCARRGRNPAWSPEVVVRSSAQSRAGDYNPALPRTSDFEMWLRLASLGPVVVLSGPTQAFYRYHTMNMSRGGDINDLSNLYYMHDAFRSWYERTGRHPDDEVLLQTAEAALARLAVGRAARALERGEASAVPPLVGLARQLDPQTEQTRSYRALRRRRLVGPRVLGLVFSPPALALARTVRNALRRASGREPLATRQGVETADLLHDVD